MKEYNKRKEMFNTFLENNFCRISFYRNCGNKKLDFNDSLSDCFLSAFSWEDTKQGENFWLDVEAKLPNTWEELEDSLTTETIDITSDDTGFKKFDQDKPRFSLIPTKALEKVARIMTFGAKKYGDFNYLSGTGWTRLLDAIYRHLNSFSDCEDLDLESNESHIAHAAATCLILLEMIERKKGNDNRYKGE